MNALVKRVSRLEGQSVSLEQRSDVIGKTVRALCDQMSFLEREIRRLSDVYMGFRIENVPGSGAADRPLSANQYRVLDEIATIEGYIEDGSAKLAQKPETPRTLGMSQSADKGDWDGHCAFGRCLENGSGIGKGMARASDYYRRFGSCDSIVIPSWVRLLDKRSFSDLKSLESVTFERASRLERIEESAFCGSGLKSIEIPSSVVVLGKKSFYECKSLESVTFESGSRLERIEEYAFSGNWRTSNQLKSILIPPSVIALGESSFSCCKLLE
jgi:hypothetical protein